MKIRLLALSFVTIIMASCEQTYECPAMGDDDFSEYFGSFSSYGSAVVFVSNTGDSLRFPLSPHFSEPYTCTTGGNAINKDCICEGTKSLVDNLPQTANSDFTIEFTSYGTEVGERSISIWLHVDSLNARFNLRERDGNVDTRIQPRDSQVHYSNDTTVDGRDYDRLMIVTDLRDHPNSLFLLSRNHGIVGFTDPAGKNWYRKF